MFLKIGFKKSRSFEIDRSKNTYRDQQV